MYKLQVKKLKVESWKLTEKFELNTEKRLELKDDD